MTRSRPKAGGRGWANPPHGVGKVSNSTDAGPDIDKMFDEAWTDPQWQERYREEMLWKGVRKDAYTARWEVDTWWSHYTSANGELVDGWQILWQQGVPEGNEFRAHLIDPMGRRETFYGSNHGAVFDAIRERVLELRRAGASVSLDPRRRTHRVR